MGLFGRKGKGQTSAERSQLREHLRDLGELREEELRGLGELAAEMQRGDGIDREKLWAAAAEVAAVDDEAELIHRGLQEKLTLEQPEQLAGGESTDPEAPEAAATEAERPAGDESG